MSGGLLGPLLFFILFGFGASGDPLLWRGHVAAGVDIVKDMGGGFLQKLTEGGVNPRPVCHGALVALRKWTRVNIRWWFPPSPVRMVRRALPQIANHSRPADAGSGFRYC